MTWTDPRPAARGTASTTGRHTGQTDDSKTRADESTRVTRSRSPGRRIPGWATVAGAAVLVLGATGGVAAVVGGGGDAEPDEPPAAATPGSGDGPSSAAASPTEGPASGSFTARGEVRGVALVSDGSLGQRVGPTPMTWEVECSAGSCRVVDVTGGGELQMFVREAFGRELSGPASGPWEARPDKPPTSCDDSYPPGWRSVRLAVEGTEVTGDADTYFFEQTGGDKTCYTNGLRLSFTGTLVD